MGYSSYVIPLNEKRESGFFKSILSRDEMKGWLVLSDETVLLRYGEVSRASEIKQLYLSRRDSLHKASLKLQSEYGLIGSEPVIIIDLIRRSRIDLSSFRTLIARLPEQEVESFLGDVSFILNHMVSLEKLYIVTSDARRKYGHPLIDTAGRIPPTIMNKKEKDMAKIPENLLAAIDELVKKTKTDKEPEKLQDYRKIFKKAIPLGFRGWVAAYLLKEYISRDKSIKMPQLEEGVTLFIGIGKNRKVYPKDLIHLFINTGKIERNAIGEIRILDNYAFVSIEKSSADRVIENLNGINYRGRTLTVNYAKQK